MDQVLFGDIFINIEQHLAPKDLYYLSQSCKKYNEMITEVNIQKSIKNKINTQLRHHFGDNHDGFVQVMQRANGAIVGSFIARCVLGETWQRTGMCICIPTSMNIISESRDYEFESASSSNSDDDNPKNECEIVKFLREKGINCSERRTDRHNDARHITIRVIRCDINSLVTYLLPLYHKSKTISPENYIHQYVEYDVYKNMYKFSSGELYIHRMNGIFSKCTKIPRSHNKCKEFSNLRERGFRFYKSDEDRKILSDEDIIHSFYDVMKIESKLPEPKIGRYCEFSIKDCGLYLFSNDERAFDIISTTWCDKNIKKSDSLFAKNCKRSKKSCIVKLLYPEKVHYHGSYIYDDESDESVTYDENDDVILMMV
jgi:hypothetical protein